MKKVSLLIIFITIMSVIYSGMNYYVYYSLVKGLGLVGRWKLILQIVFIILASTFIIGRFLQIKFPVYKLTYIGNLWFGIISIAITVFIGKDILILLIGKQYKNTGFILALLLVIILIFWSIFNVIKGTIVKEVKINSSKYQNDNPLNIVLLSDVHLSRMVSTKWLKSVVKQVNGLSPDVIVITGDFVDDDYQYLEKFVPILKQLKSKLGIYAVAGNHDHFRGVEGFANYLEEVNVHLLLNEGVKVSSQVNLIGLDEGVARYNNTLFKEVLSQCKSEQYNILLSHQPVGFKEAVELGVDLQLSGHTHNGQILPLNLMINIFYRYAYGLYKYKTGHIYTTSGTGTWGPPMRLFSNCEVVKLIIDK